MELDGAFARVGQRQAQACAGRIIAGLDVWRGLRAGGETSGEVAMETGRAPTGHSGRRPSPCPRCRPGACRPRRYSAVVRAPDAAGRRHAARRRPRRDCPGAASARGRAHARAAHRAGRARAAGRAAGGRAAAGPARWAWRCRQRGARAARGGCRQGCSGNGGLARAEVEQRGQVAADGAAPGRDVGSATPKRCSMKRSTEVWSKTAS